MGHSKLIPKILHTTQLLKDAPKPKNVHQSKIILFGVLVFVYTYYLVFVLFVVIVIVVVFPQEKLDDLDIPLRTQVMSKRTNTWTE